MSDRAIATRWHSGQCFVTWRGILAWSADRGNHRRQFQFYRTPILIRTWPSGGPLGFDEWTLTCLRIA